MCLHKVILTSLAELYQFRDGLLKIERMNDILAMLPALLESFFCMNKQKKLTSGNDIFNYPNNFLLICYYAGYVRKLFTLIKFSEQGNNNRVDEEATYMFFLDYMDACESNDNITAEDYVSLESILSFFTGSDTVPPLGYASVTLSFNKHNIYPTSSTCAVELTLPTIHKDFNTFKEYMDVAMTMHGGFGLV